MPIAYTPARATDVADDRERRDMAMSRHGKGVKGKTACQPASFSSIPSLQSWFFPMSESCIYRRCGPPLNGHFGSDYGCQMAFLPHLPAHLRSSRRLRMISPTIQGCAVFKCFRHASQPVRIFQTSTQVHRPGPPRRRSRETGCHTIRVKIASDDFVPHCSPANLLALC